MAYGGDPKRLAITGFCWGGRISWLYAARNKQLKAAVARYGQLVGEPNPLKPRNPVDTVDQLDDAGAGAVRRQDTGITQPQVER